MKKNSRKRFLRIIGFIIKILYTLSLVLIVCGIFVDREKSIYTILGYAFITIALIAIFLTCKYPESIDLPKVTAYKFKLDFNNYKDFINYLDSNVNRIKYKKYDLNNYSNFSAYYYIRKGISKNKVEYFVVLKNNKISMSRDDFLTEIENIRNNIFDDIERYYKISVKNGTYVGENYILLSNEETNELKELVNINTAGGFRYGVIICGYSFDKKILYISNQKDGQYFNYIYMRNKFLKVMNLKMKDQKK